MSKIPYILTAKSIIPIIGSMPLTVNSDHPNYEEIVGRLVNQTKSPVTERAISLLIDTMESIKEIGAQINTGFAEEGYILDVDPMAESVKLTVQGYEYPLPVSIMRQLLTIAKYNGDTGPIENFLRNLIENPDKEISRDLFDFLQTCNMAITEDGCFLAYKVIGNDWKDKYSRTYDNSPGKTVSMPRFAVTRDRKTTCSQGLHICAWGYIKDFGSSVDRIVIVKINPAHVVSVPSDYRNQKMRVCEYSVIEEVQKDVLQRKVYKNLAVEKETVETIDEPEITSVPKKALKSKTTAVKTEVKKKRVRTPEQRKRENLARRKKRAATKKG